MTTASETSASRLRVLRSRLRRLRDRRTMVRWGAAGAAWILAVLALLLVDFVVDWAFQFGGRERLVLLTGLGVAALWCAVHWFRPLLATRETELDMALLVENRQKIDSDLVAALQFAAPHASNWGSSQLQEAVIDYVADFGNGLNVFEGLDYVVLRRRWIALGLSLIAVATLVVAFPDHASTFVKRLLLSSTHYPTRTHFTQVRIAGQTVRTDATEPQSLKVAQGRPIVFEVLADGRLPERGQVVLKGESTSAETSLELSPPGAAPAAAVPSSGPMSSSVDAGQHGPGPVAADASPGTGAPLPGDKTAAGVALPTDTEAALGRAGDPGYFRAELPRLAENARCQLYLGDAWTDPIRLEIVPLPVVSLQLLATAPSYARVAGRKEPAPNARQISVMEGSRVTIQVTCANKALRSVSLVSGERKWDLRPARDAGAWELPTESTPFERVVEALAFEIRVEDQDGMSPEHPIAGHIRLQADHPPRIGVVAKYEKVLPTAHPSLQYEAVDDHGISMLRLHQQVVRAGGELAETVTSIFVAPEGADPEARRRGTFALDLKPLKLLKGDQLRVTLEAVDFRGRGQPGKSVISEAVTFQVTDESGVLASLSEADEKSARQLDAIIQRQLGIGESP